MRQAAAQKLVPAARPHPLDGKPVLESAPLRRGHKRSALSRFEDSTWDLSSAVFRENARVCHVTAHFKGIEDPSVVRVLREFLYARLNFDIPGHRTRLPPGSIRQLFNRTRRFLEFVAVNNGDCNLAHVDQALLDAYRNHLTDNPQRRSVQVAHLLEVVVDLHHFRECMPSGGLELLPWNGRSAFLVAGAQQTSGENKTPRLPEQVISPLLKWSLKYITVFSVDVLAARAELEALQQRQTELVVEDRRFSEPARNRRRERLIAYLDQLRANGAVCRSDDCPQWCCHTDPITGIKTPPINAHLIQMHVGVDPDKADRSCAASKATKQSSSTRSTSSAPRPRFDTSISIDPDTGKPWRPRLMPRHSSSRSDAAGRLLHRLRLSHRHA
jgi:hypothetical protein